MFEYPLTIGDLRQNGIDAMAVFNISFLKGIDTFDLIKQMCHEKSD